MFSGLIGAAISNPLDMALIRFQADNSLALAERRNYSHVFDALSKMRK
jgi:solute carrier family 25 (mitochondrial oxoglutarate transporter), member 11